MNFRALAAPPGSGAHVHLLTTPRYKSTLPRVLFRTLPLGRNTPCPTGAMTYGAAIVSPCDELANRGPLVQPEECRTGDLMSAQSNGTATSSRWVRLRWTIRSLPAPVRLLAGIGLGVCGLGGIGITYQEASAAADRERLPPPGMLIEVDGHRLHLRCIGKGSPTVILETGLSGMSAVWAWIQPDVARSTRVCSYDRPGLGWSEMGSDPHDGLNLMRQLHELLQRAGVDPPYVLVGHSLGALYARIFAGEYPAEVAGLVLVDPSHPDQLERFPREATRRQQWLFRVARVVPWLARVGLVRLTGILAAQVEDLPPRDQAVLSAFYASPQHLAATRAEIERWGETCRQAAASGSLGQRPLVVLSASNIPREFRASWRAMHRDLARLSSQSRHRVVAGADHVSLVLDRRDSRAVSVAIGQVVWTVRGGEGET